MGGVTSFTLGVISGLIKNNRDKLQLYVHKGNKHLFNSYANDNVKLIELDYGIVKNTLSKIYSRWKKAQR